MSNQETHEPPLQEQPEGGVPPAPELSRIQLAAVKVTDVGRVRTHNEDYVDFYVPPDPRQLERKGAIYVVADGMGGHQAGEVASQGAVELVIGQFYSDTTGDIGTSLVRAFRAANKLIYDQSQADSSKAGMGTTLVAAVILGRKVYLANVGDSRAYLVNPGGLIQITEDHSWVEDQVRAGLLTPEQATHHPQRNLLTRALGTKPDVEADLFEGELGSKDMLVLCSDGLTGRVTDAEIEVLVQDHPPEEAGRLLVALANERGGNDNITVLIVGDQEEIATLAAPVAASALAGTAGPSDAPAAAAAPDPTPPPAPITKRSSREFPWIPVLAGVAGVLIILLGALLLMPLFQTEEPTPTLSPSPLPVSSTATLMPEVVPSETVAATEPVSVEETPVEQATASGPTATLANTNTPLPPSPTAEPAQAQPTNTRVQPSPTTRARSAPTLVAPASGVEQRGEAEFEWTSAPIPAAEGFQVLIWKDGRSIHEGAAEFTNETSQRINLDILLEGPTKGPGKYYWSVVVVDRTSEQRISSEAAPRFFNYPGPKGSGSDRPDSPGAEPTVTPDR